jgi:hypothetical protein
MMNAFFKAFTNSQCGNELHNELGDDDRLALLKGFHIVFIKNPSNPIWIFFTLLGDVLDGITFIK